MSQASAVLKTKGRFYMVHRPFRLAEIMRVMMQYNVTETDAAGISFCGQRTQYGID